MNPDDARVAEEILREHAAVAQASVTELQRPLLDFAADLYTALQRGGKLIVFGNGGSVADAQRFEAADHAIRIPSISTPRIQEMHITVIHAVCSILDRWLAEPPADRGE